MENSAVKVLRGTVSKRNETRKENEVRREPLAPLEGNLPSHERLPRRKRRESEEATGETLWGTSEDSGERLERASRASSADQLSWSTPTSTEEQIITFHDVDKKDETDYDMCHLKIAYCWPGDKERNVSDGDVMDTVKGT